MSDKFNGWDEIGFNNNINIISNYILTSKNVFQFNEDSWIIPFIGSVDVPMKILDFGCGIGRNTFGISSKSPLWHITGYDNQGMLSKTREYKNIKHINIEFNNVDFQSDWDKIKELTFDCIFCTLVLQHIKPFYLKEYLEDFKKIGKKLVVHGRRFNDDEYVSTWKVIEDCGLIPDKFYKDMKEVPYSTEGNPDEHNMAIYNNI